MDCEKSANVIEIHKTNQKTMCTGRQRRGKSRAMISFSTIDMDAENVVRIIYSSVGINKIIAETNKNG